MQKLLESLSQSSDNVKTKINNTLAKINEGELETSSGISYLEAKHHLLLQYCINLSFFTLLKLNGKKISEHPIVEDLARIRVTLEKLKPLDQKLKYQVDKLLKMAASGSSDFGIDPKLKHKANIRSFVPLDQDMINEDGDIVSADGDDPQDKKYVVPKISAVAYEDKKAKREKQMNRMKERAKNSSMAQHLIEEYGDQPLEKALTIGDEFNPDLDKEEIERAKYEEEMFIRLQRTKKDTKKRRHIVLPNELDDLEKLGQITSLDKFGGDDDFHRPKKQRKMGKRKK